MATAVLVLGAWSSPADWRWVAASLHAHGAGTVIPDLPSHRYRSAGRSDDVQEVEAAIRAAAPPVVVAGWSYGGAVVGDLAETGPIGRLVYVASIPEPAGTATEEEPDDLSSIAHMLFAVRQPLCSMMTGGLTQKR
jgi:pimeloyl-ACP methyl ester carboxylesterase